MTNTISRTPSRAATDFGRHVRDLRRARGWTQTDLADRLALVGHPLHQTTVAKLERGTRPTTVDEVHLLALLLGVSSPGRLLDAREEG